MKDGSVYAAVEFVGYWLGGGTAAQLGRLLGITREHAQRAALGAYRKRHPDLIAAEPGRGFRFSGDDYDLRYAPHSIAGFLDLLRGLAAEAEARDGEWLLRESFLATSLLADPGMKAEQMRGLMAACVHRRCVDIEYVSARRLSRVRFSPHTLVACAHRPHFRGFAVGDDYERYIDIVPGRTRAMEDVGRDDYIGPAADEAWHERVDLSFVVDPELPASIRDSVLEENNGRGRLEIKQVRRAVELYVRREIEHRFVMDRIVRAWRLDERHAR